VDARLYPITFPLSFAGKTEVRMAMAVPKIIEPPIPCIVLDKINNISLGDKAENKEARLKIMIPMVNIFFLPTMSAILPNGTRKAAATNKKEVATQLKVSAFIPNSIPMVGNAILMDAAIKGIRNADSIVIIKVILLLTVCMLSFCSISIVFMM
jgi:hypothetical protein